MIVPVMAISNLVLTQQIYSEETNGAHAHNCDRVPLMFMNEHRLCLTAVPDKVILSILRLCRTSTFKASHFNRIAKLGNFISSLKSPSSFPSLQSFKQFVYKTMFTTLVNIYEVERSCTGTLVMTCPCHRSK